MKENLYWIGIKQSEISMIKNIFCGSVCLFGTESLNHYVYHGKRPNQNIKNEDIKNFYIEKLNLIIESDPNCKFMFYNQNNPISYGEKIMKHTICCNKKVILDNLSNKIWCRKVISNIVSTVPSYECIFKNIDFEDLGSMFPGTETFIIQKPKSGGGTGTFKFKIDDFNKLFMKFDFDERVLISPYFAKSYSINTTIIIGEKNCLFFPSSIQIIEEINNNFLYRGADFLAFNLLNNSVKKDIEKNAILISKYLKSIGYIGIVGIDFLVENNNVLFVELNDRFQASSDLLNLSLLKNDISLQELNKKAFEGKELPNYKISSLFSSYLYYNENPKSFSDLIFRFNSINNAIEKCDDNEIILISDGYNVEYDCLPQCYGFKINCKRPISIISPDGTLWINENVRYVSDTLYEKYQNDMLFLKIALLNQGVCISDKINNNLKEAVYNSIDVNLSFNGNSLILNCPYKINFSQISPFFIDENYYLNYAGKILFPTKIDELKISNNVKTSSGNMISRIVYMSEDRLRIKTMSGCDFKRNNIGCDFCNNPPICRYFNEIDIIESINYAKNIYCDRLRHFMIGGGTDFRNEYWNIVENVVNYIKKTPNFPNEITLMVAPFEKERLFKLKNLGINDLSVNIEIFDDDLAKKLMKGKGIKRKEYFDFFQEAKKYWPQYGDLRSMVMVGLDTTNNLLKLISKLIDMEIQPVLSIFRPLPSTPLENYTMPSNSYLENIYYICEKICKNKKPEFSLGPKCSACKNNVLAI